MYKLLALLVLTASVQVQAETFRLNLSVAEVCKQESAILTFITEPVLPPEFRFLAGGEPSLSPLAIQLETKYGFEVFGAANNSVRVTNTTGQFFSIGSNGKAKLYIETPKEVLCDPNSKITFVFELAESNYFADQNLKKFGTIQYTLTTLHDAPVLNAPVRTEVLKLINSVYLEGFMYFLSDQFAWFEENKKYPLVDFFYNVDANYLLSDLEVERALTNPKFNVETTLEGNLRLYYGATSFLEFSTAMNQGNNLLGDLGNFEKLAISKIKNNGVITFDVTPKPTPIFPGGQFPKFQSLKSKKGLL